MEILENLEVIGAIGVMSTFMIQIIKKTFGKKYIKIVAKIIPAMFALMIAIMSNYGLDDMIFNFIAIGGSVYAVSAGLYKLS